MSAGPSDWTLYRRLMTYVWPLWLPFSISILGYVVHSGATVGFAELLDHTIDAIQSSDPDARIWLPLAILAVVLIRSFGGFAGDFFLARVSFAVVHQLRIQLFEQLLSLPSAYFDKSSQGHLVSRITYNVFQVREAATTAIKTVFEEGTLVIGLAGYLMYKNWKLALVFIAVAPVIGWIVDYAGKRFRRISRRIQNSMGNVTHVASETVTGYRVVRTFGGEKYERQRFTDASEYNTLQHLKMVATKAASTQIVQVLVACSLCLLVWLVLDPVFLSGMDPGAVVAFITAAGLMSKPIRKLTEVNAHLQRGLAAAQDIFDQFDEPKEQDTGTLSPDRVRGQLEFRNVDFSYQAGNGRVLKGINLKVEPGQTVALVGRSGSGKSSLVSLIPRFYSPDAGEILLDGEPLDRYNLAALRRQIALVQQQVTLFNDTVGNNIAYGTLGGATEQQIRDAARRAQALGFIEKLPEGITTQVGDNGVLLSGGQRQRLAIARAILKDAPVLILDEATSALDSESERLIQRALEEVMRDRTTVVIAHRLSTIEDADMILVMDEGRVVEQGTHAELLARDGAYAELHQIQFSGSDGDSPGPSRPALVTAATSNIGTTDPNIQMPALLPSTNKSGSQPLVDAWYGDATWVHNLGPLESIYRQVVLWRRNRWLNGSKTPWKGKVPVVVVGNITVGGTGKTPLVAWLARWLTDQGVQVGIVSRGYGGRGGKYPLRVAADTSPTLAGDEAPLLASRGDWPVIVDPNRPRGARALEALGVDLIIADDGLQHHALGRDLELALLDGVRGLGNGRCLPAGPLREPVERLAEVDFVLCTGQACNVAPVEYVVQLQPVAFVNLATGVRRPVHAFRGQQVHAVAGIGNPQRFFTTLAGLGALAVPHPLPDHHRYRPEDVDFADLLPVLMTEKDAMKCRGFGPNELGKDTWYLEVMSVPDPALLPLLAQRLTDLGITLHAPALDGEIIPPLTRAAGAGNG